MEEKENKKDISNNSQEGNENALSFLKVDSLRKRVLCIILIIKN